MRHAFVIVAAVLPLAGCGTGSILDYSMPRPLNPTAPTLLTDVRESASHFAQAYKARAEAMATTPQLFDLGLLAAGILGVTSAAFDWSRSITVGAGIAGGSFAAAQGYWAPRARLGVYVSGFNAMSCIATLANRLETDPDLTALGGMIGTAIELRKAAGRAPGATARTRIHEAARSYDRAIGDLTTAIDTVNLSIAERALKESQARSLQSVVTDLEAASRAAQAQRTTGAAAVNEVTDSLAQGQGAAAGLPGARSALAVSPDMQVWLLERTIEMASSLRQDLDVCIALAR